MLLIMEFLEMNSLVLLRCACQISESGRGLQLKFYIDQLFNDKIQPIKVCVSFYIGISVHNCGVHIICAFVCIFRVCEGQQ